MSITDDDKLLIRACILERYIMKDELDFIRKRTKILKKSLAQFTNQQIADKFETTLGVVQHQERKYLNEFVEQNLKLEGKQNEQ